jgi:hypothetical protein
MSFGFLNFSSRLQNAPFMARHPSFNQHLVSQDLNVIKAMQMYSKPFQEFSARFRRD